ncbi:ADP-ribosylglycohydrolase family protein [Nocardia sp. CDC159]|uniref:ADP-ribosylglycohydrolase family protein n=1 Tax=Nocardia pulmonis TaxID=2951408 RepID=A0A9X2EEB3_9NOCA|nr:MULTISPECIES: ADP-ribosylglycohydrolase family protein [Nocardia]MCM6777438.1 ADP-ribosylglycohydrolase family protein [Nocardia pulmonis]MCM6790455.1 ADP-ribosylglycohydrolase family protein [Nocardia sp. CDC159]
MESIDPAALGHPEADPRALLYFEWLQRRESGCLVDEFAEEVHDLTHTPIPNAAACWRLLDRIESAPRDPTWPYVEDGDEPGDPPVLTNVAVPARLYDRILGGWLGRCVGCTLGKPLENGRLWTPVRIRAYLERAGAYPLADYVPVLSPMPEGCELQGNWPEATRGRVDGCPRDDDLDYTVLGLNLLEQQGWSFTSADVAAQWLELLPFLQTYTAERVAYRNLIDGFGPPATARHRNPYREWIGAVIRVDAYGYVCAGDPARAAELAARDAAVSHTGNGAWAARWAAALVAAAFTAGSAAAAIDVARQVIPPRTRLAEAVETVVEDHRRGLSWDRAIAAVHARHAHYDWVHAVGNAAVLTAGLLWGAGDFTATVGLTVQGGWDTDSNGATAGSVAGILAGANAIPGHWTEPLHDTLRTAVSGYDGVGIAALARRTFDLARRHIECRYPRPTG